MNKVSFGRRNRGSGHIGFERVGELVYRGQRTGVLLLHVLNELFLGGEVHLRVAPFLLAQRRVAPALVVVAGTDEQFVGQAPEDVVERMVLPGGVAVQEVGASAGAYEQRVGGEDSARQQYRDQVLGVPRRVQELERQLVAEPQPVAVLDPKVNRA